MSNALTKARNGGELTDYVPTDGLKIIAAAEVAEKYWRRAKDPERLYEAVEHKLTEQRNFVLWWDAQEKAAGARGSLGPGRGNKTALQTTDAVLRLDDLGLDRDTVHRWRTRLANDKKFEAALEAARERCRRVCEAEKGATDQKGATGTGENEWYTPDQYLDAARAVLGEIDLDPASSDAAQEKVRAARYFTKETDGLAQEWPGRVWLNPPYAQPHIANFVTKLVKEVSAGRTEAAILLTHNYTDTAWFHEAASIADAICFTRGRIKFCNAVGEEAAPTQGQAFCYYGPDVAAFASWFGGFGAVVVPYVEGAA